MTVCMLPCDSCGKKVDVGDKNPTLVLCGCDTASGKAVINDLDHSLYKDVTWEEEEEDSADHVPQTPTEICDCPELEFCAICCPF